MTVVALTNAYSYVGGHDFTSDVNEITLNVDAEALDTTTFGSGGWRALTGGLKTVSYTQAGYWQSAADGDAVDPQAYTSLGVADQVVTVGPDQANGGVAYLLHAGNFAYELLGTVGNVAPFKLTGAGTNSVGVVRGRLASAKTPVAATGPLGAALNLGGVAAGQYLYGTVHVLGGSGGSLTVVLESDEDDTFGSPTTRATVGPVTAPGGVWATRVAGPLTDPHYRWRVTAVTGTYTAAAAIGIQ